MNRQRMLQLVVAAAVIVSVGLIAWLLADAPPPATDEPVVEQPARRVELVITGRVVDSAGAPIASATVRCQQVHTKTDKHGMFTCRGLPAGRPAHDASASDYVRPGIADSGAVQVAAAPEAEARSVVLTLRRPGSLHGHVVASARPVAGANLEVLYRTAAGLQGSVGPFRLAGAAVSDAQGRFAIAGLAPGRIEVRARLGGDVSALSPVIDLREGQRIDDLLLRLQPGGTLSGVVRSRGGVGLAARVEVRPNVDGEGFAADCDVNGRFTIAGIPPGTWLVEVTAPGFRRVRVPDLVVVARAALSRTFTLEAIQGVVGQVVGPGDKPVPAATVLIQVGGQVARVTVDGEGRFEWHRPGLPLLGGTAMAIAPTHATSEVQPVEQGGEVLLRLGAGGNIAGRVLDAKGGPAASAVIHLVGRKVKGPDPWGAPQPTPAHAQPDGSFSMGPFRPGRYDFRASLTGQPPGISRDVMVVSGGLARVTIRLDGGTLVHGRVSALDGAALVAARVRLMPLDGGESERHATTDEQGLWKVPSVPPGRWALRVSHASHLPELIAQLDVPDRGELRKDVALRPPDAARSVRLAEMGMVIAEGVNGYMVRESAGAALAAGLRVNDRITSVDFRPADKSGLQELSSTLGGEGVDMLSIEIERPGEGPQTIYLGR